MITRRMALVAGAAVTLGAASAPAQSTGPRQVITRAELEAGGWTRLSELVFAIRGASRATVDGITVQGNLTGTPSWPLGPARGEWLVLIDEQPIGTAFAGTTILDLLPVALAQLDSVVVQRTPGLAAGRFASHGILRLHTRRAEPGAHGSASHYSGNEVGDPGPFTFTPEVTPNIDNSGPFHQARLAYGAAGWDADVAFRRWTDNLTDRRIAARHEAAAAPDAPELWVRHLAPTLRAGITAFGGRHDVHAGTAQLRGTYFVPSVRVDQSLATRLTFGGVSGDVAQRAPVDIAYRLSAAQLESAPYGAPLPSTLAHERRELAGGVALGRSGRTLSLEAGASVAHHALGAAPALQATHRESAVDATAFVAAALHSVADARVQAMIGHGLGGIRSAVLLSVSPITATRWDSAATLHLTVSREARAYGDDGAWVDLELFGIGALADDSRTTLTVDAELRQRVLDRIELAVGGGVRREDGLYFLTSYPDDSDPDRPPFATDTRQLTTAELRLALDLPVEGPVLGGATYRFANALGGYDVARRAAASLPQHLFDASVVLVPFRDIRIRPAVHLASSTRWQTPSDLRAQEPVPSVARFDLSLEKWFFARHLRAQLLARNLLNNVERYHPLGADFRLRVFAGATLSF